jgi:hypothetical protein
MLNHALNDFTRMLSMRLKCKITNIRLQSSMCEGSMRITLQMVYITTKIYCKKKSGMGVYLHAVYC